MLIEKMLEEIDEEISEVETLFLSGKITEALIFDEKTTEDLLFEKKEIKRNEDGILQDVNFLLGETFDQKTIIGVCRNVVDRYKVLEAFFAPWQKK